MDDDDDVNQPLIGKGPRSRKGPNPLNDPYRPTAARGDRGRGGRAQRGRGQEAPAVQQDVVQEEAPIVQAQEEAVGQQSRIPPFDDCVIVRDWTITGLLGDPIDQYEDTCGSVVFTNLLEATYNKDNRIEDHRHLNYMDLAEHIKSITKSKKYGFRNLKIPIRYIKDIGIHKDRKMGKAEGTKTKGRFESLRNATTKTVYEKLDTCPLGIVLDDLDELHVVGKGIYLAPARRNDLVPEHAMLVVGHGTTGDGVRFLVIKNSWGVGYGNSGYCRIFLPENGRYDIFWPLEW